MGLANLGWLKFLSGDLTGARVLLERAHALYPNSTAMKFRLGAVYDAQGEAVRGEEVGVGRARAVGGRVVGPHGVGVEGVPALDDGDVGEVRQHRRAVALPPVVGVHRDVDVADVPVVHLRQLEGAGRDADPVDVPAEGLDPLPGALAEDAGPVDEVYEPVVPAGAFGVRPGAGVDSGVPAEGVVPAERGDRP